jgi:LEA14-like dessication related protein
MSSDIIPILKRIHRKSDIMRMDAKSPTARSDAEEIRTLAEMAIKKLENPNDEPIPLAGRGRRED